MIYLRSTPDELFRRLRHDTQRPLLQVKDPLGRLRDMYGERDPLYREVAHFVVDTGRPSVPSLVNMLLMQLELAGVIDPASGRRRSCRPKAHERRPAAEGARTAARRGGGSSERRAGFPRAAVKLQGMSADSLQTVAIDLADRSYDILIGPGLLSDDRHFDGLPKAATAVIVTNETVAPLYAQRLEGSHRLAAMPRSVSSR